MKPADSTVVYTTQHLLRFWLHIHLPEPR